MPMTAAELSAEKELLKAKTFDQLVQLLDNGLSNDTEYQEVIANTLWRKLEDANLNLEKYDLAELYQKISMAFARNEKLMLSTEASAKARVYSSSQAGKNNVTKNNNLPSVKTTLKIGFWTVALTALTMGAAYCALEKCGQEFTPN